MDNVSKQCCILAFFSLHIKVFINSGGVTEKTFIYIIRII